MKKRIIRGSVLTVVFVLALVISSLFVNKDYTGMTAEMDLPTLPVISFEVEGQEVNVTEGHRKEMDLASMRDTITPLGIDGSLVINLKAFEQTIQAVEYEVFSLDGTESLLKGTASESGETVKMQLGAAVQERDEAILQVKLDVKEQGAVYYYTRICDSQNLSMDSCLDYVQKLHKGMLEKTNTDLVKRSLESNAEGDNTTLQHVNIHSDLEHANWGDLKPQVVGDVSYSIQETKEAYTSIKLRYRVQCAGDNNAEELYDVKEFFRVRHLDGNDYLLTYDRTLEEVFDGSNVVLARKGIILGLAASEMKYKSNTAGTIVTFVQNRELWSYDKEENSFTQIFTFHEAGQSDLRNEFDKHSVRILSMEENGNVTFAVYGYMNRGLHEGESGVAVYYFKLAENVVEEKVFIPSTQPKLVIEEKLGELAFYNDEKNVLYVLADQTLYKIDFGANTKTVLLEGLQEGQYVSSNDGHLLAYQKSETQAEVLDFINDARHSVSTEEGESIRPLGFLSGDFIYGVARTADIGTNASGETVTAMYKLEIRDGKNEVIKTYQVNDVYVEDVQIETNLITLNRIKKKNGIYVETTEDYITNNEEKTNRIELQSYWTDLKETQYRLAFEDGIEHKKAKVMTPVHVLFEDNTKIAFEESKVKHSYMVYGQGELAGVYDEPGDAIQRAKELSGVVISPQQNYIWEDGNRVAWYRNFEMPAFTTKSGESTLAASVRAVLAYEGSTVDVTKEMQSKTVLEIMQEHSGGEGIRFRGCLSKDMCYLIDKGVPVIAMTGKSDAIVFIGYDARTITYIDPSNGAIRNKSMEAVDKMLEESGYTFFGYTR